MSAAGSRGCVHVAAGAVIDTAGRVLIAQRPTGTHLAGGWEFPGGKLEPGEERRVGLARELSEELGITIAAPRPLIRVRHSYPHRDVLLDVWIVRSYVGEPSGLDGQALRWCTREELAAVELLPADGPIVRALWLPERLTTMSSPDYRISDDQGALIDGRLRGVLCRTVDEATAAASAGADFLVMRRELARDELAALCAAVPLPVYARGVALEEAWERGATGVYEIGD